MRLLDAGTASTPQGLSGILESIAQKLLELTGSFMTIALTAVGIVAITVLVWALAKKRKGGENANDAIMDAAFYTILVVVFMLIINVLFFNSSSMK